MKRMKNNGGKRILSLLVCAVVVCAALVTAAFAIATANETAPELDMYATNLSFSDSIYIKYAVAYDNLNDNEAENVKLLVWKSPVDDYVYDNLNKKNGDVVLSPIGTRTIEGKKCLIFDFTGLAAKEMTDYVYARAYYTSGDDEYYSEVKKYSVLTYAYNKLGYTGTRTENEDLAALLEGLLEYGASAQLYFDHKTDALANVEHVQVTLEKGKFADGSNTTLAIPGTKLTVIAPDTDGTGSFLYWTDAYGNLISRSQTFEITVGETNTTLRAEYISCMGGDIEGAGAVLDENSFALTEHTFDSSKATEMTAAELETLIENGLTANAVYRVSDETAVKISASVNGNGSVIIAPNGVTVEGNNFSVENLIIIGSVSVENSDGITLRSVDVQSMADAVIVDSASKNIVIDDYRLISDATGKLHLCFQHLRRIQGRSVRYNRPDQFCFDLRC